MSHRAALLALALGGAGCHLLLGFDEDPPASSQSGSQSTTGPGAGADPQGGAGQGGGGDGGRGPSAGGGGQEPSCQPLSEDDFAGPAASSPEDDGFRSAGASLARWGARFFEVNEAGYLGSIPCSAELCDGGLRLVAGPPGNSEGYFWHTSPGPTADQSGPLVYQLVTGDFALEAQVELQPNGAVIDQYTGASLVIRNPNAFNHYVQYSFGTRASAAIGTLGRYRYPGGTAGGGYTLDVGQPTEAAGMSGRLLICRIGNSFSFHRLLAGDSAAITDAVTSLDVGFTGVDEVEAGLSVHWFHGFNASFDALFGDVVWHGAQPSHQACRQLLEDP